MALAGEAPKFDVGIEWGVPPVDLVMGSQSDAPKVLKTAQLLDQLGVPWEAHAISAHRTPEELQEYCDDLVVREEELVVVAFAGMAAALGGDTAARIPQTVIGVPLMSSSDTMEASTAAQLMMPPGSGLVIVGPDQMVNAGLAALRVLGTGHSEIREQLTRFRASKAKETIEANAAIHDQGLEAFVAEHS